VLDLDLAHVPLARADECPWPVAQAWLGREGHELRAYTFSARALRSGIGSGCTGSVSRDRSRAGVTPLFAAVGTSSTTRSTVVHVSCTASTRPSSFKPVSGGATRCPFLRTCMSDRSDTCLSDQSDTGAERRWQFGLGSRGGDRATLTRPRSGTEPLRGSDARASVR